MRITVLIDNPKSWFIPQGKALVAELVADGHTATLVHTYEEIPEGDCLFLLSCGRIVGPEILKLNKHNIVIHSSKLPEGRGFAPLIWQILEGRNEIWVTAFEAVEQVDAGVIYLQEPVQFEGHELHDELRSSIGAKIIELALRFVRENPKGKPQEGASTWYRKRTPKDSELDPNKTLIELFPQLRTASNTDYPTFFAIDIGGKKYTYTLQIERKE
jgi:methionyl-tRNA formyltransferase